MSPEQAKGRTVDKRGDVWAFGAVLYEMLTGQRAFAGSDVSDVLASVLAREPDWARLPTSLSPVLGTYIRRCLQKDRRSHVVIATFEPLRGKETVEVLGWQKRVLAVCG